MYITIIYIYINIWNKNQPYTKNTITAQRLLQLAKAEGLQTTSKEIIEFLAGRAEEQQLKVSQHSKQSLGHLVSYNPFNRLQLDIFVLQKI